MQLKRKTRKVLLVLLLFPLLIFANSDISDKTAQKNKIAEIKQAIAALDERLKAQHQEKTQLQASLVEAQTTEQALLRVLADTKKDIATVQRKHTNLKQKIDKTQQAVSAQEEALIQEIQLMYRMGPIEQLKLWLNQSDPALLYRMQRYFSYLYRAREQHVEAMRHQLTQLHTQERKLAVYAAELKTLQATQQQESALLQRNQQQQKSVLAALETDITYKTQTREALLADQKALEALLKELVAADAKRVPQAQEVAPITLGGFAKQKNNLTWPLKGVMLYRFGQPRAGGLKWDGAFIQAAAETPVHAIYPGRVIYADRLRGFGLLLIIDHGDNYMSLYGNNKSLYRKAGDVVAIGDQIAAAGAGSEHLPDSGLYFEIRLAGQPQDPTQFLTPK